jgi:hypothetical protein
MLAAGESGSQYPVIVIDDPTEIRKAVGFRVDGAFTPTQRGAEAPRQNLPRYLAMERERENGNIRHEHLLRIGQSIDRYFWHCGGYVKDGQKYLFCSFVRYQPSDLPRLRRKVFPVIHDGGTSVCRCHFSIKLGRIVRLAWNGEA